MNIRRKYDTEDANHLSRWAHDRLDRLEPKLDKLMRNMWMQTGALALLFVLLNYPQLINVLKPSQAIAKER